MDRDRNHKLPESLKFMMWPALVRAPWLIGSIMGIGDGEDRRSAHRDDRRRR